MRNWPAIQSVNVLFLISAVLVVIVGTALQIWSLLWGLAATEVLLILLPALIFLWRSRLPPRETLRLRWPGARLAGLSLLIGAGIWLVAAWLDSVMSLLLGYSIGAPADFFPTTPGRAALLFFALAVLAPLCEETLFRGVVQRGYERQGPWAGILMGGLLFAFFHMRFQGLLGVLPIALALGYVVWRSDSLWSGILLHFANNALAAGLLVAMSLRPDVSIGVPSLPAAIVGAVLAFAGLWLFRRGPAPAPPPAVSEPKPVSWLRQSWPLFIAGLIYTLLATAEFVVGRFPHVMALDDLKLRATSWERPARWQYELRNLLDEPVGRAECRLTPEAATLVLECKMSQAAFEAKTQSSYFNMGEIEWQQTARWDRETLALLSAERSQRSGEEHLSFTLTQDGDALRWVMEQEGQNRSELTLPASALLSAEWPWRLSAMPFSVAFASRATVGWTAFWEGPVNVENWEGLVAQSTYVVVRGAEPISTPAGNFVAWRVTVGERLTAWYAVNAPHTLLRYEDGVVTYELINAE